MKFGVRQCANIVFRAKNEQTIGSQVFHVGQPVLYIDSATTSSLEQATTTVYAQGGRGNARLISWEGEKTVTFTFTDALLSPIGFGILSGAGIFRRGDKKNSGKEAAQGAAATDLVHFHTSSLANLEPVKDAQTHQITGYKIDLTSVLAEYVNGNVTADMVSICSLDAPIYIMEAEADGSVTGSIYRGAISVVDAAADSAIKQSVISITDLRKITGGVSEAVEDLDSIIQVMVDFYVDLPGQNVWQADITAETFGGNYYVEADTLFRNTNGEDLAANLTFPNVKIQSNFTMTFASTGDPSTFDFTMDAFPDFTYFDKTKKVICVLQILDYNLNRRSDEAANPVMPHNGGLEHEEEIWYGLTTVTTASAGPSQMATTIGGKEVPGDPE